MMTIDPRNELGKGVNSSGQNYAEIDLFQRGWRIKFTKYISDWSVWSTCDQIQLPGAVNGESTL